MCAEVRGYSGSAVIIAETILALDKASRSVHLGGAEQSFLIPIVHTGHAGNTFPCEREDTGTAGVRTRHSVAAGAGRLCTNLTTQVEVIVMGAEAVTRFPLLHAVLSAHVEAQLLCAEVRAGNGGGAVFIAVTPACVGIAHLGVAPLLTIAVGLARVMRLPISYEGEDAGTAGVRTIHSVAAGAGRLCTDVPTEVEVIIIRAGAITRFPLLQTVLPTHVESMILCAEVRTGDGGGAVFVAEAISVFNIDS